MTIPKRGKMQVQQGQHRGCEICRRQATQFRSEELPSLWINSDHVVAHPNAPVGSGGAGFFRNGVPLGGSGNVSLALPHPTSPAAHSYLLTAEDQTGLVMATKNPPANPPPVTVPVQSTIKKDLGKYTEVDVVVEITPDSLNDPSVTESSANTSIVINGLAPDFNTTQELDDKGKVKEIDGKVQYKGTLTIQIRYRAGIDPSAPVAYGRGTTDADIAAGNVSIGFHEWCHQQDLWTWLTTHDFPQFKGKIGMTKDEYIQAQDDLDAAWQKYLDDSHRFTHERTDNTGSPTKDEFTSRQSSQ